MAHYKVPDTTGYKLFHLRKDGTIGPLFINKKQVINPGTWCAAKKFRVKGYAYRPGWHILAKPHAPHLAGGTALTPRKDRVWALVEFKGAKAVERPAAQGGKWFLTRHMKVIRLLAPSEVL